MMAFDEGLAHRVEELIADYDGFEAKMRMTRQWANPTRAPLTSPVGR
jgi:hypothetical protein